MDTERIALIKSLAKVLAFELVDQVQHYKDVFEIDVNLHVINRDILIKKFKLIINDHLCHHRGVLPKDSLWRGKEN